MRRVHKSLLPAVILLLLSAGGMAAQGPDTPVSSEGVTPVAAAQQSAQPATQSPAYGGAEAVSALPQREQAPRTLRAYWHVFIAFAVTWVLLFGYALSLGRRWARLEEDLVSLQRGGTGS